MVKIVEASSLGKPASTHPRWSCHVGSTGNPQCSIPFGGKTRPSDGSIRCCRGCVRYRDANIFRWYCCSSCGTRNSSRTRARCTGVWKHHGKFRCKRRKQRALRRTWGKANRNNEKRCCPQGSRPCFRLGKHRRIVFRIRTIVGTPLFGSPLLDPAGSARSRQETSVDIRLHPRYQRTRLCGRGHFVGIGSLPSVGDHYSHWGQHYGRESFHWIGSGIRWNFAFVGGVLQCTSRGSHLAPLENWAFEARKRMVPDFLDSKKTKKRSKFNQLENVVIADMIDTYLKIM
mmetsp:Transcript_15346/g.23378  ORF Transcript_15346/g.23378 Transcript_15346/m.23378 type:complete len:287 (+) Transcript_15346:1167-2027(+)